MDDISGKISEVLSDPESLEKIKLIAGMLSAGGDAEEKKDESEVEDADAGGLGIDPAVLMKVLPVIAKLGEGGGSDHRVKLLAALRPYLSPDRARRVDEFVNVLKLSKVAEALGDTLEL